MSHQNDFKNTLSPDIAYTINLIKQLHKGQVDHSGKPYVEHPLRVASNVKLIDPQCSDDVFMAALLHDTIEDCNIKQNFLRNKGYSEECITMVLLLTKPESDSRSYAQVIDSLIASSNRGAMLVKLADNMDNLHPERTKNLLEIKPEKAARLQNKYTLSIEKLTTALAIDKQFVLNLINNAKPIAK
jgi:(p)ppGpp synthase/HD superfamily hydrolase